MKKKGIGNIKLQLKRDIMPVLKLSTDVSCDLSFSLFLRDAPFLDKRVVCVRERDA